MSCYNNKVRRFANFPFPGTSSPGTWLLPGRLWCAHACLGVGVRPLPRPCVHACSGVGQALVSLLISLWAEASCLLIPSWGSLESSEGSLSMLPQRCPCRSHPTTLCRDGAPGTLRDSTRAGSPPCPPHPRPQKAEALSKAEGTSAVGTVKPHLSTEPAWAGSLGTQGQAGSLVPVRPHPTWAQLPQGSGDFISSPPHPAAPPPQGHTHSTSSVRQDCG